MATFIRYMCMLVLLTVAAAALHNAFIYYNYGGLSGSFMSIILVGAGHLIGIVLLLFAVRLIWRNR